MAPRLFKITFATEQLPLNLFQNVRIFACVWWHFEQNGRRVSLTPKTESFREFPLSLSLRSLLSPSSFYKAINLSRGVGSSPTESAPRAPCPPPSLSLPFALKLRFPLFRRQLLLPPPRETEIDGGGWNIAGARHVQVLGHRRGVSAEE